MALVADYGSDEDSITDSDEDTQYQRVSHSELEPSPKRNFFNTEDSEGSESSDSENEEKEDDDSSKDKEKLPNPLMYRQSEPQGSEADSQHDKAAGSVFINPYHQEEQAKASVLEKHVKMVEKKFVKGKAGQVCFKFKRGRCRFGKSCKYSHDLSSELISTQPSHADSGSYVQGNSRNAFDFHHHSVICQPIEPEREDDDSYMSQMKRKKRSGVTDNLQPPKKALQTLERQRETERPWTMKRK